MSNQPRRCWVASITIPDLSRIHKATDGLRGIKALFGVTPDYSGSLEPYLQKLKTS